LATIRELRVHEQQARWRSIGEVLIYEENRGELLASALAYLYGRRYALMKKTLAAAATDEQPDEIQRVPGLLLWLAWDCGLQVDNRAMFGEEPDAARERAAQKAMLLAIAPVAAANLIAREEAEKSILRTARPSQTSSSRAWLATQLAWGEHLSKPDQRHTTDRLKVGDVAYIAARGPRELYVVSTSATDYIGLVDLSEADAEVRFLPDRIARFSSTKGKQRA
jgi:hypothetical protein